MKSFIFAIFFLNIIFGSIFAHAEEADQVATKKTKRLQSITGWSVGVSTIQWTESLKVTQAGATTSSTANLNGLMLQLQRETFYRQWGWSLAGVLGVGGANGGSSSGYLEARVPFATAGVSGRVFSRLLSRLGIGVSLLGLYKNVSWPAEGYDKVESGQAASFIGMFDMNIPIFKSWDFYQGIGLVSDSTGAFWRVGASYRF